MHPAISGRTGTSHLPHPRVAQPIRLSSSCSSSSSSSSLTRRLCSHGAEQPAASHRASGQAEPQCESQAGRREPSHCQNSSRAQRAGSIRLSRPHSAEIQTQKGGEPEARGGASPREQQRWCVVGDMLGWRPAEPADTRRRPGGCEQPTQKGRGRAQRRTLPWAFLRIFACAGRLSSTRPGLVAGAGGRVDV